MRIINIETFAPVFNGFYNSIWSGLIDNAIEYILENDSNDTLDINYNKLFIDFAKTINDTISNELVAVGLIENMKFDELHSPQFYNFTNDTINSTITLNEDNIKKIKDILNDNIYEWTEYLEQHFTSISGFISAHANTPDDEEWNIDNIINSEDTNLGFVLDFILDKVYGVNEHYIYDEIDFELDIYEYIK